MAGYLRNGTSISQLFWVIRSDELFLRVLPVYPTWNPIFSPETRLWKRVTVREKEKEKEKEKEVVGINTSDAQTSNLSGIFPAIPTIPPANEGGDQNGVVNTANTTEPAKKKWSFFKK